MAKYHGVVGYSNLPVEDPAHKGIWRETMTEKRYVGDIERLRSSNEPTDHVIDDIALNMSVSVIADQYAVTNFSRIRYASYMGTNWKVESVEVEYPRLILTLGGPWNGATDIGQMIPFSSWFSGISMIAWKVLEIPMP